MEFTRDNLQKNIFKSTQNQHAASICVDTEQPTKQSCTNEYVPPTLQQKQIFPL